MVKTNCGLSIRWNITEPQKEQTTDTEDSIDKSQKHLEQKKPETREYILFDSTYMKFWKT